MKQKIERPNWAELVCTNFDDSMFELTYWFDTDVEPINKLLSEGDEVYIGYSGIWTYKQNEASEQKALIINPQPIVKWECPCGEKAMFADTEDCRTPLCHRCAVEIKAALEREDG